MVEPAADGSGRAVELRHTRPFGHLRACRRGQPRRTPLSRTRPAPERWSRWWSPRADVRPGLRGGSWLRSFGRFQRSHRRRAGCPDWCSPQPRRLPSRRAARRPDRTYRVGSRPPGTSWGGSSRSRSSPRPPAPPGTPTVVPGSMEDPALPAVTGNGRSRRPPTQTFRVWALDLEPVDDRTADPVGGWSGPSARQLTWRELGRDSGSSR